MKGLGGSKGANEKRTILQVILHYILRERDSTQKKGQGDIRGGSY